MEEKEKEGSIDMREKHQLIASAFYKSPSGAVHRACNPGMCPDWELNLQPFSYRMMPNPLSLSSRGRPWGLSRKETTLE